MVADRSGSCSMFVDMDNLATKTSSRDDGLVARLAISTEINPEFSNHQRIGCLSLYRATTSLIKYTAKEG